MQLIDYWRDYLNRGADYRVISGCFSELLERGVPALMSQLSLTGNFAVSALINWIDATRISHLSGFEDSE